MVEPGRWLVGPAGVLLASVVLVKRVGEARFVVLDAAMNDLMRPAMYDAWHGIVPLAAVEALAPARPADVVGPVCESSDTFARDRALPALAPGARVAILDCRCLWRGDEFGLQRPPARRRGDGRRRPLGRDPPAPGAGGDVARRNGSPMAARARKLNPPPRRRAPAPHSRSREWFGVTAPAANRARRAAPTPNSTTPLRPQGAKDARLRSAGGETAAQGSP